MKDVMNQQLNVAVIGASFETGNLGVNALARSTIEGLLSTEMKTNISVIDYSKTEKNYSVNNVDSIVNIPLIPLRFTWKFWIKNNIVRLIITSFFINLLKKLGLRYKVNGGVLERIYEQDLLLAVCGGDSFSDIYGKRQFLYVALPMLLTIVSRKKLVMLPQTYGPFKSAVLRTIAVYIVRNTKLAFTRDAIIPFKSEMFIKKCKKNIEYCPDMAFILPIKRVLPQLNKSQCFVGLNISGLLYMGGYKRDNSFGLLCEYKNVIVKIIDYLIDSGNHIYLIPHVFGCGENSESDTNACDAVMQMLSLQKRDKIIYNSSYRNEQESKALIGQCDFFIGSRMHACIAALSQTVPAVGIAYSDKFAGVFQSVGCSDSVCDARKLSDEQIYNQVIKCYKNRENTKRILNKKIPEIKKMIFSSFSEIINE